MSKINTFVCLKDIQTLEDVLRTDWMELTELTPMGNRRPYFVPDSEEFGISTEHYKVKIVRTAIALDHRLDLRRVEELSDFPDCKYLLTGWKGDLYVRVKPTAVKYTYQGEDVVSPQKYDN